MRVDGSFGRGEHARYFGWLRSAQAGAGRDDRLGVNGAGELRLAQRELGAETLAIDGARVRKRDLRWRNAVAAAEGRLTAARAIADKTQRGFRAEDIAAARADLILAEGQLKEAQARWAEREVRSPAAAVVETMDLRPGDLLAKNSPVAQLLEADQLYLMVYLPETKIGLITVGQEVQVRVDSFPQVFKAHVEQIRQRSEYLPRNVQTKEERVHQVIGVKLRVENKDNRLRAGISADVTFAAETK